MNDVFDLFLAELNNSIKNRNFLSAITIALILPNICASIESDTGDTLHKDKILYKKWLNENTCYKFDNKPLSSEIIYEQRCKLLHNGKLLKSNIGKFGDISFVFPSNCVMTSADGSMKIINGGKVYIQINIDEFIKNIIDGVQTWRKKMCNTDKYKSYTGTAINLGNQTWGGVLETNIPSFL